MELRPEQKDYLNKARKDGKIIHTVYEDMYWFPDELEKAWIDGKFRWALENFRLENPKERLDMYKDDINKAKFVYSRFKEKYKEYLNLL